MTIDQAYQFVQFVANKEQRGNITPDQFNMLAPLMQMSFINDRIGNLKKYRPHDPIPEYGYGITRKAREELRPITVVAALTALGGGDFTLPSDFLYAITVNNSANAAILKETVRDEDFIIYTSVIKPPTVEFGTYSMRSSFLTVTPASIIPRLMYIKKPTDPRWNYTNVNNSPVYTPTGSVNFSVSELSHIEICMKILQAVGVNLSNDKILTYAGMEEAKGS